MKWYAAIQGARVLLIISPSTLVFSHYWEQGTYELLSLHTADLIFTSQGVMILTKSAFICLRQLRNQALWALSFALMQPFSRPMKAMPFHLMFSQSIIRQGSTLPGQVILVLLTCEIAQAVGIRILSISDQRRATWWSSHHVHIVYICFRMRQYITRYIHCVVHDLRHHMVCLWHRLCCLFSQVTTTAGAQLIALRSMLQTTIRGGKKGQNMRLTQRIVCKAILSCHTAMRYLGHTIFYHIGVTLHHKRG